MNFFLDTSALVKLFHVEPGTDIVTRIVQHAASEIWISDLARLEFTSAIYRRFRNQELDELRLHTSLTYFENQLHTFRLEPLNQLVIDEAGILLRKYGKVNGLRTLDALHLGTYSLISEHGWCFVTADTVLFNVAREAGFLSLYPLQSNNFNLDLWIAEQD